MKITIKSISLLNFKGVREFKADFNEDVTEFRGDNATGKTTLFDAFTWCLYGKDSLGRSDFQIKTLDENNEVIWKQPHEVAVSLLIDNEIVNIRKTYNEVWTKKRGKATEEFAGHTIERFWNDVPVKEKEFNEKINEICNENTFRLITNPMYFLNNLSKKDQRNFLIDIAGDITPASVAAKYPEFQKILNDMSGKSFEDFAKEIVAKIKRIKVEAESLPARIDERKRDMPEAEDWNAIKEGIKIKQSELDNVHASLESDNEAYKQAVSEQTAKVQKKSELKLEIAKFESDIETRSMKSFYDQQAQQSQLKTKANQLNNQITYDQQQIGRLNKQDQELAESREELVAEWHKIKARVFDSESVDRDNFVCPTCGQHLPDDNIDQQIDKMEANYNAETSRLLENNKRKGLDVKIRRDHIANEIQSITGRIESDKVQYQTIISNPLYSAVLEKPTVKLTKEEEKKLADLKAKYNALAEELEMNVIVKPNNSELTTKQDQLQNEINDLRVRLGKKEIIDKNEKRIAELNDQYKTQNEEIAELEGIQFQIAEFKKALITEVEDAINGLFSFVKFKMYEQQINGGEKETCEALVNGVPYSTNVNTAARINAGIDIINAICKHENVFAPIWVDNRESITNLIDTDSQVINLYKDENYIFLTKTN